QAAFSWAILVASASVLIHDFKPREFHVCSFWPACGVMVTVEEQLGSFPSTKPSPLQSEPLPSEDSTNCQSFFPRSPQPFPTFRQNSAL
ncbi:MAG: hypothetical protein AAB401_19750, partial [Acidobacteriota bacterium]